MSTITKTQFLEAIEKMSVLELSELVEAIKEKFNVQAVAVAAAGASDGGGAAAEEEKSEFNVVLKEVGQNKIAVIKEVKALLGLGLKEAKEVVENPGKPLKEGVKKEEAEEIKAKLEGAGATVELT